MFEIFSQSKPIGPCCHVEFLIQAKNTFPIHIHAKFSSLWLSGFWGEDWNVKNVTMDDDGRQVKIARNTLLALAAMLNIWSERRTHLYRGPPNAHLCQMWFHLALWLFVKIEMWKANVEQTKDANCLYSPLDQLS